jgi:hypothetical protein
MTVMKWVEVRDDGFRQAESLLYAGIVYIALRACSVPR